MPTANSYYAIEKIGVLAMQTSRQPRPRTGNAGMWAGGWGAEGDGQSAD